jgi:hypothetical protein
MVKCDKCDKELPTSNELFIGQVDGHKIEGHIFCDVCHVEYMADNINKSASDGTVNHYDTGIINKYKWLPRPEEVNVGGVSPGCVGKGIKIVWGTDFHNYIVCKTCECPIGIFSTSMAPELGYHYYFYRNAPCWGDLDPTKDGPHNFDNMWSNKKHITNANRCQYAERPKKDNCDEIQIEL